MTLPRTLLACMLTLLATASVNGFDPLPKLDRVWQLVDDHFYDPQFHGVDWEACRQRHLGEIERCRDLQQCAAVINHMLDQLETSHTRFYTREDPEFYFLVSLFRETYPADQLAQLFPGGKVRYAGIGAFTREVDGAHYVTGVIPGYPAAEAGLRRGTRLWQVNDAPFHPIRSFADRIGETVTLRVQSTPQPDDMHDLTLQPVDIDPQQMMMDGLERSLKLIRSGERSMAYARMWSYAGQVFHDRLCEALFRGKLKGADALILDLRDGWGGARPEYVNLFNRQVPQLSYFDREGTTQITNQEWRKPVALLINNGTRSGKELLAYAFRKHQLGPLVGERTAGAVTAGRFFLFDDGSGLYLAVRGVRADGEILEGRGVAPTIAVPWPLPYGSEQDPQLNMALQVLEKPVD
ncbi:MAG: S41 family peptidase [Planctomycetota bacterium]